MLTRIDTYLLFVYAGVLSWVVPLFLLLLNKLGSSKRYSQENAPHSIIGNKVHPRYLHVVHAFIFFLIFLLILVPCATALFDESQKFRPTSWLALLILGVLNIVSLLYLIKKKDHYRWSSSRFFKEKLTDE